MVNRSKADRAYQSKDGLAYRAGWVYQSKVDWAYWVACCSAGLDWWADLESTDAWRDSDETEYSAD